MNSILKTHTGFNIQPSKWHHTIQAVRDKIGESDHLQQYHLRPWITNGYTLYVRNDLLDDSFITYLGLIIKFN